VNLSCIALILSFPSSKTRTLVRTEGIITQLIFDHALRVRMKAEVADGPASTTPAESVATTPDTASIADTTGTNGDDSGDETLGASSATVSTSTPKKPQTPSVEDDKTHADGSSKADNLIGKINNLVTTGTFFLSFYTYSINSEFKPYY
jgi:hypothetical protein